MCPQIAYHFDCEKDYSDRCEFYDDLAEERFREIRDLVADICRKDSPLHLGIVRNMDCLNEVIEVDFKICYNYMRSKARVMMEYIQNMDFEAGYEGYLGKEEILASFSCLTDLFKNACLTSKTSDRCGSNVKDIAIEVLTRENSTYRVCSDASDERLEELLSLLNLGSQEKAFLNIFLYKG
ncbi:unnamed protein product [Larinioides sclopetarius]|uniref:Uncharacterized protein n=1 Tax=Larinioides sclopetarius TaxID=280406 RepID=A0AAV2A8S8_9ARAC